MPTFTVLSVPVEEMALDETVQQLAGCRFRIEECAFGDDNATIHVWITCEDPERIVPALDADSTVSGYEQEVAQEDESLFEVAFEKNVLLPRHIIQQHGGTVQQAFGSESGWSLHVRFQDRSDLSAADDSFDHYDIDVTYESIEDIHTLDETRLNELTAPQREGVETALEMGYYDVPRKADLSDVADRLDVSHQALSERLRRAQEKLASERLSKTASASEQKPESP